ncbi:MAG: DUF305 domain-containing protein, partial [Longimicrobiales bacterium]
MTARALRAISVVFTLTAAGACASSAGPASEPAAGPDLDRLEAIARARADSARMNVHEADVDFMQGMIHHHAQALVMSAWAPDHGASPAVQTLTARIINAQRDEIALMQRWLRERGREVPEVEPSGHMPGMAGDMHMHMPGMLSPEQLARLDAARGAEFDRLFLTYMIQHHEGAVTMVHDLFAIDGAAQDDAVFKIASDIQVDQKTEIARMQRMLDA